jgi:LysM repeat protein
MKRGCELLLLFLLIAPPGIYAQGSGIKVPPANAPDSYQVKQGDTLWGISSRVFGNPFSWQNIWKLNGFISDPHWIYPGQTLSFAQKPALPVTPAPAPVPAAAPVPPPAAVERPGVNVTLPRMAAAIPAAPAEPAKPATDPTVIRLLTEPSQIFTEKNFMRTGFIAKLSDISKKKITGIEGVPGSAIRYDTVTIDMGSADGVKAGTLLAIISAGDRVKHPDTGVDYGFVVRVKGFINAETVGANSSRCVVRSTFDPLAVGDQVMLYQLKSGPMFDAWVKPDTAIRGEILAVNEPMLSIHPEDILYIDKGERDGVRPGDRFTVFARATNLDDTGNRTPLGDVDAISVMPDVTAVIVTSLRGETITIGDQIELTARCRVVKK